jgi:phosphoglucosamine mutase
LIAIWRDKTTLHELKSEMSKLPQVLKNVRIKEKVNPMDNTQIAAVMKEQESRLAGQGRVLLRASGTEPLIRVMAEGADATLVNSVVDALVSVVESTLA